MDDPNKMRSFDKGKNFGDKKLPSNLSKEEKIKKKLSNIQKKIGDLQHRRKLAQKHSVKAKKNIHNEINQIVKKLRTRERILLSNVDETYALLDENISEELLKLQSVYSHCQALFTNLNGFSEKAGIISNITSTLAEINCKEKTDIKSLIFYSDFEEMKCKADTYGYFNGDFAKQDQICLVMDENNFNGSPDIKRDCVDQDLSASNINPGSSYCCLEKTSFEDSDFEETFEVINLIDNLRCNDIEDCGMDEESVENSQKLKKKLDEEAYERECKVAKTCVNSEKSNRSSAINITFNPDEEWKKIEEMNKKLVEFKEKQHFFQKEADKWLFKNSQKDVPRREKNVENINTAVDIVSPADLIQKSFQSYQVKGDTKYWLASN